MKKPVLLALAGLALAAPAFAQQPPASPAGGPPPERDHRMMSRMCADADARIASRLAYVEAKVKPTQTQRSAWEAFARDSRTAGEPMKRLCDNPPTAASRNDAAAQLARRETFAQAMVASLAVLRPAVERFQAVLDDAQKSALAEALSPRRMMRRHP